MKILILLLSITMIIGCSGKKRDPRLSGLHFPYVIDMHQGNILNNDDVTRLQIGMSKEAVKEILGEPLLIDTFHDNRWDYVQIIRLGKKPATKKSISLFFNGDSLFRIKR